MTPAPRKPGAKCRWHRAAASGPRGRGWSHPDQRGARGAGWELPPPASQPPGWLTVLGLAISLLQSLTTHLPLPTFTPLKSIFCMVAKVIFLEESSDQTLPSKTLHRILYDVRIKFKFSAGRIQVGHLRSQALPLCLHKLGWMPSFHSSIISYTYFFFLLKNFFVLTLPHNRLDLSSLTRDRTCAPCSGSMES